MDFSLSDDHRSLGDLAARILGDSVSHERLKQVEAGTDGMDRTTWAELGKAGLLGAALDEADGGAGQGFLGACAVLFQIGRTVAPVPFLSSVVMGALPVAVWGSTEQKAQLLPGAVTGERILTAALVEDQRAADDPGTTARPDGAGWRLDGAKSCVPAGTVADTLLVPARRPDGSVVVHLVDRSAPGVTVTPVRTTNGQVEGEVRLEAVGVDAGSVLGGDGADVVAWIERRATAGLCITMAGVCERALEMTAEYARTRHQFDRPIASFQAVGQRAADAYIDTEAIRLTAWQAAWRLDAVMDAEAEIATAKFWAADGGQRVVHAAQHLHGGIGVDRDYPLHRYFLWAKHLELTLGGATAQLVRLGALLAAQPV